MLLRRVMSIEIREHTPGEDIDDFIRAGRVVFEGDPAWVAPLEFDLRARLTPAKNPFFQRGEVTLFTAWKDGRLVGRTSAQIDHEHLRLHGDETGFFGFFDTIDDDEVGKALIDAAAEWLQRRGMKKMRGPLSLNMNEEVGVLIEGHEHPPVILMGHSRAWQDRVAGASGLEKAKDAAGDAADFVKDKAGDAAEFAKDKAEDVSEFVRDKLDGDDVFARR